MRIDCPLCGERNSDEFSYLGSAATPRPVRDADVATWLDYVYLRDNPAGCNREYWHHQFGCRAWLIVERDTRNHAVLSATRA